MQTAYALKDEQADGYGIFDDKKQLRDFYAFFSRNTELTFYQCVEAFVYNPNITAVKTYDDWHDTTDRRILRGSKGIPITNPLYPNKRNYYFDVSQTYGFKAFKTGENITDTLLLDAIKSQCFFLGSVSGTYRDRLYSAVKDYCENNYLDITGDEEFMKAVTDGVFTCIVNRYNKPLEYVRHEEYISLDDRSSTSAALAATRIAETLFNNITKYRSKRDEKSEQQRQNRPVREVELTGTGESTQQSFFEFFDQVRDTTTESHDGIRAEPILRLVDGEETAQVSYNGTKASGQATEGIEYNFTQEDTNADKSGNFIPYESTLREPNSGHDTRDNFGRSDLSNYKLTDENFENLGGTKTRYNNNVKAIRLLKELEESGTPATKEEQDILARYAGWGGIPQAFDELKADWKKEYTELKELLSDEEYSQARGSTLNAHFTSKTVIDGIYAGLNRMGLSDGIMLEPSVGTGNFIGLMPDSFKSKVHAAELDTITGKIAKHLYPNADIQIKGFEETDFPDNYFDGVATNVPFGSYSVFDTKYNKHNLYIHDYFILKSLDKLRHGGIAAIVTSKGTLDKANASVRKLFAEKAEFLGAVRLPNNAFKATAGTEVTADVLFFRKGAAQTLQSSVDWLNVGTDSNGVPVNQYYIDNPHMVLGTMKQGQSMYGSDTETYCEPNGRDLKDALSEAVKFLPENIYMPRTKILSTERKEGEPIPADLSVKNYCYAVKENKIYMRVDNEMVPQNVPATQELRFKGLISLRQQVRNLLKVQQEDCSDEILEREQGKLNAMYGSFVKNNGALNTKTNRNIFRNDADYTLLISLEHYDEVSGKAKKTDIFSKRTIRKYTRPTRADTVLEALQISKNETGRVNLKIIEELTNKSYDDIITELDGHIYRNPEIVLGLEDNIYEGWETATEYLSGNVRRKLDFVKTYAESYPRYNKNIEALEKVQPTPLTASEISVRMGMGWIDAEIYKQFLCEKFNLNFWQSKNVNLSFNQYTQSWKLEAPNVRYNFEATNLYGTERMNGCNIYEHAINLQTPSVYDKITESDGKEKRVLNKSETIAVREKLRKIQEEFKSWVFDCPDRREKLVNKYNEKFNNLTLTSYDGSYLTFPEMNPLIELKPFQKDAVERIITSGNTLLHHVVGAGKTFEVAAAAMKLRQLKLAQKPMIIVPNHLVLQWANEFRYLYPQANLLIATKKDFEKENRLKFVSRIATGDWDAVIMAMSSFEKIPISNERREKKIREEIDAVRETLENARDDNNRITIKIMEKVLKDKEKALKELSDSKKDDLIKFEDLGVDYLFCDEAHKYKNKFIYTKMTNVAGISQAASKRSSDLDMKIDYLAELHGGAQKGVVFATGTPISNSMVEMFTMQSYLQRQDLLDAGLNVFDHWAANFGETVSALELAPSGQGYRSKTRFAKFTNLPELLKMYRKTADVKTAEMLNLPVPKANKHIINIKPTDTILELCEVIAERAERINNSKVDPSIDNMLKITGDGRKLALDPRCFDSHAPDSPDHKVNIASENIYRIWLDTEHISGTQLVFCDLSTPKTDYEDYDPDKDFDVYNHVKTTLVQMGIPPEEVAYIHDAKNDIEKQILFNKVRAGNVRILIGSTEKCGAGTNVQNKLVALHHLDTPYRPSDLEQREGRAIRQGNTNAEVDICTYVTERTFDAYSYQILENKQRFISQVNKGELTVREAADIDETTLTYAEIKAITSANPLIKRKNEVENEVGNLQVLESQYRKNRYALQDKVAKDLPHTIANAEKRTEEFEQDIALRNANTADEFSMTIAGKHYTEKKDAVELLHKLIYSPSNSDKVIAKYKGFEIIPETPIMLTDKAIILRGNGEHRLTVSESPTGTMTRIDNALEGLDGSLKALSERIATYKSDIEAATIELSKPFEHAEKISDLTLELEKINAELNLDKGELELIIDDTKFQNEVRVEDLDEEESGDGDTKRPIVIPEKQAMREQDYEMG